MKYNKIISLLAVGTLFGPTLLTSQQVLAEEISTVTSESATTVPETQPSEEPSAEIPETQPTEPVQPEQPVQATYQLQSAGQPLANNTLIDANGNQIVFQYDSTEGLVEGTTVHYTVTLATGFELKEVKISNQTGPIFTNGEINGAFSMPSSDVSIELETTPVKIEETPAPTPKPEEKPDSNQNNSNSNNQNNHNKETPSGNTTKPATQ